MVDDAERRFMGNKKLLQDMGNLPKRPMILGMDTDKMTITEITENIRLIEEDIWLLGLLFIETNQERKNTLTEKLNFKNYDLELLRESLQKFNDLMPPKV